MWVNSVPALRKRLQQPKSTGFSTETDSGAEAAEFDQKSVFCGKKNDESSAAWGTWTRGRLLLLKSVKGKDVGYKDDSAALAGNTSISAFTQVFRYVPEEQFLVSDSFRN